MIELCDNCGFEFEPDESSFMGDLSGDTDCGPFTQITTLCPRCYKQYVERHGTG